tara:strand:+ start:8985 stop:9230 length:246 start_codon:yes stop_codon:yes gene_type:complete
MKKIIDERVRLPSFWKHLVFSISSISALAFIFKDGIEKDIGFSFLLFFSGLFTGLAVWSLTSLINYIVNWASPKSELKKIK